jgi:hypothetical protein
VSCSDCGMRETCRTSSALLWKARNSTKTDSPSSPSRNSQPRMSLARRSLLPSFDSYSPLTQAIQEVWAISLKDILEKEQARTVRVYLHLLIRLIPRLVESVQQRELLTSLSEQSTTSRVVKAQRGATGRVKLVVTGGDTGDEQCSREERTVLAVKLIESIAKLFFMPGFTVKGAGTAAPLWMDRLWEGRRVKAPSDAEKQNR